MEVCVTEMWKDEIPIQYTCIIKPDHTHYKLISLFDVYCHIGSIQISGGKDLDSIYYAPVITDEDAMDELCDNTPPHNNNDITRDIDRALKHIKEKWAVDLYHSNDGCGDPFLSIIKAKNKHRRVIELLFD